MNKEIRGCFVLIFLSILKVDPLGTESIKKDLIERYSDQFRPQQCIGVAL